MRAVDRSGEARDVGRRQKLTPAESRRAMILEMALMRERGYSVVEIARKYRYHRWHVYRLLRTVPESAVERMHAIGL